MLHGGAGADKLVGSDGWGVADYHDAATAVTINLDGSGNSGDQAAGDTFVDVNGVQGSQFGDTLNGNASANWMIGDAGNDTVNGGEATIRSMALMATTSLWVDAATTCCMAARATTCWKAVRAPISSTEAPAGASPIIATRTRL